MVWYFAVAAAVLALAELSRAKNRHAAEQLVPVRAGQHGEPPSEQPPPDRRWNIFDLLAVALLVGFSASRYYVGTDWEMYYRYAQFTDPDHWPLDFYLYDSPHEVGYTTLEYVVRILWDSPHAIFWAASTLTVVPAYAVLKRFSSNLTISLLFFMALGFWVAPFNIMRQGIAMGLNFWAASYLDRSKRLFFIVNAVAGLIHATAWIAAVIQFLAARLRLTWHTAAVVLGVAMAGAVAFAEIASLAQVLTELNPRYELSLTVAESGIGTYLVIAVRIAMLAFILWRAVEEAQARWFTYAVIGTAFLILGTQSVVIARLDFYFGIFLLLLLPTQLRKKDSPGLNAAIYLGSAAYFAVYLLNFGGLLPYQTYLDCANCP